MRSKLLALIAILMLSSLAGGVTSPAAAAQDATILSITLNGCFIDIVFQVEDAGNYYVNLWDDGTFRAGAGGFISAGGTATVRYLIGDPILEGAAGIGIYVEDALGPAAVTTYDSNGSYAVPAVIGDACADANDTGASFLGASAAPGDTDAAVAGCDVQMPRTPDAAIGTFVANADTYWSPGNLTDPLVTLPAGKSAWVLGLDANGEFYKIIWSCQLLWVEAGTIGPNFDAVWQGHPLPTTVVN